jgi:hypothetical protein
MSAGSTHIAVLSSRLHPVRQTRGASSSQHVSQTTHSAAVQSPTDCKMSVPHMLRVSRDTCTHSQCMSHTGYACMRYCTIIVQYNDAVQCNQVESLAQMVRPGRTQWALQTIVVGSARPRQCKFPFTDFKSADGVRALLQEGPACHKLVTSLSS